MIRLELDLLPPSLTTYLRLHWAQKKKWRQDFAWALRAALSEAGLELPDPPAPKKRVRVTVHRIRLYDEDNLKGGCKPLWDGMRDIGLIRNDTPRWLRTEVEQKQSRSPRTEIEIEEIL